MRMHQKGDLYTELGRMEENYLTILTTLPLKRLFCAFIIRKTLQKHGQTAQ